MKSKIYLTLVILLVGFTRSKSDCSEFKQGKFICLNKEEKQFDQSQIVIRTINKQIYIDSAKNDTLVYDLKWVSDCEYQLINTKSNLKKEGFVKIGDTLLVTIEPIDSTTFKYRSLIEKNGFKREFKGKMKKIE